MFRSFSLSVSLFRLSFSVSRCSRLASPLTQSFSSSTSSNSTAPTSSSSASTSSSSSSSPPSAKSWSAIGAELRDAGYDYVLRDLDDFDEIEHIEDYDPSAAEEASGSDPFAAHKSSPEPQSKVKSPSSSSVSSSGLSGSISSAAESPFTDKKSKRRHRSNPTAPAEPDITDLNPVAEIPFSPPAQFGKLVGGETILRAQLLELRDGDLLESFSRGSGKGGQAVNKTANCVHLRHLPTGTMVRCHATRSLERNREIARKILKERLEELVLGPQSSRKLKAAKIRKQKDRRRRRRLKKELEKMKEMGLEPANAKEAQNNANSAEKEEDFDEDEEGDVYEDGGVGGDMEGVEVSGPTTLTPEMREKILNHTSQQANQAQSQPKSIQSQPAAASARAVASASPSVTDAGVVKVSKKSLLKQVEAQRQLLAILDESAEQTGSDQAAGPQKTELERLLELQRQQEETMKDQKRKAGRRRKKSS